MVNLSNATGPELGQMPESAGQASTNTQTLGSSDASTSNQNQANTAHNARAIQAYLVNLLRRIQPGPGVTRQQRLQQMIRNGELKREDIVLLQRHQQFLRRQRQIRMEKQQLEMNGGRNPISGSSRDVHNTGIAGKTVPGTAERTVNNTHVTEANSHHVAGKSVPPQLQQPTSQQQQKQSRMSRQKLIQQQQQQQLRHHKSISAQHSFFGLTQQQLAKLTPQQRKLLMIQQLRKKARTQRFYESNEEILKKYENFPPSLELHVHENYYRFGNNDVVIPKNSATIKEFLKFIARCEIPDALMEVIRDGRIQMYDGSLILKVLDHRRSEKSAVSEHPGMASTTFVKRQRQPQKDDSGSFKPKEYRTVLRMDQQALYDDLSLQTDSQQFHDTFALAFESEILTASNRNVNLQPLLNPYHYEPSLRPEYESVVPHYNSKLDKMEFPYRKDAREIDETIDPVTFDSIKYKPLHEDLSRANSKYEQLMTILNQTYRHSNRVDEAGNEVGEEPVHFDRLRFIENWRRKLAMLKQQNLNGVVRAQLLNSMNPRNVFSSSVGGASNDSGRGAYGTFVNSHGKELKQNVNQGMINIGGGAHDTTGDGTVKNSSSQNKSSKKAARKKGERKKKNRKNTKRLAKNSTSGQPTKKRKTYKRRKKDVKKEKSS